MEEYAIVEAIEQEATGNLLDYCTSLDLDNDIEGDSSLKLVFRVLGNANILFIWFDLRQENLWKVESVRADANQLEKCAGDSSEEIYS